jgi:beta-lactamase regulating signal transducer with metallopeptidase domain
MIALAPWTAVAADWLLTFALHSTVALALACCVSAVAGRRTLGLQETLLRWSMWAALVSSTLQVVLRSEALGVPFVLPGVAAAKEAADLNELISGLDCVVSTASIAPSFWSQWAPQTLVVAAALAMAAMGIVWLFAVHRRLQTVLAERQPETDPRVLAMAAEVALALGLQQSPHVSRSARLATPIAFGFVRPEICLPCRVGSLGDGSLRAMLAHEVAHLRAADPAWMWGAAWLQALFPWQLLFVAVRRRWSRLVELRCDAIAASAATPTAVARCLLDVADWLQPQAKAPVVALGMAARPSALRERIEAALRGDAVRPLRTRLSVALGALLCSSLSVAVPGVVSDPTIAPAASVFDLDANDATLGGAPPEVASPPVSPAAVQRLQALAGLVAQEHDGLRREVVALGAVTEPSAAALRAEIESRLQRLDRMRIRLDALLVRIHNRKP